MNTTSQPGPVLRDAGEGTLVRQTHSTVIVRLEASQTEDGRIGAAEFTFPAGFGPPLHVHHAEDEVLQVLEGTLRIIGDGVERTLGVGGFAYLPRGVPHTFRVEGDQPARALAVFTPGGVEELFTVTPEEFDACAARFRIEFVGPPPA